MSTMMHMDGGIGRCYRLVFSFPSVLLCIMPWICRHVSCLYTGGMHAMGERF